MVAVLLKDEPVRPFLDHGVDRQHDAVLPTLDRDQQFHALAGLESPADESMAVLGLLVSHEFVGQSHVESQSPRFQLDFVLHVEDLQVGDRVRSLAVGFDDGRDRRARLAASFSSAESSSNPLPFDVEHGMIAEHTEQVTGLDVLPRVDFDLGHLKQMLVGPVRATIRPAGARRPSPAEGVSGSS